jgi:hypothetical protein
MGKSLIYEKQKSRYSFLTHAQINSARYPKPHTDEKSINLNHQPTEAVHGATQKVF